VAPFVGPSASGILTVLCQLTSALAQRDHEVEFWYGDDSSPPTVRVVTNTLEKRGVRCRPVAVSPRRGRGLPVVDLPRGSAADIVHIHSVFVPMNTALIHVWSGPVVLSPHGGFDALSLRRSFVRKRVYSALYERRMVRRAAVTVALTEIEAAQVRAFAGDVATAVVPNGITQRPLGGAVTSFRDSIGISTETKLALFVGRLDVCHKGLDRLVAATAAAPTWRLVLVGPDHRGGRQQLQRMADKVGVTERMHFVGQRNPQELTEIYSAADLFVLPSRWEGLPMSLLEALAHGVPALVTPEVDRLVPVGSRRAGWVSDPNLLGRTLEALATVPHADWSQRAESARALSRDYDWDEVSAAYEVIYRNAFERWAAACTGTRVAPR
jgi:glycosyltransferase involved in cell wall biosynthesis